VPGALRGRKKNPGKVGESALVARKEKNLKAFCPTQGPAGEKEMKTTHWRGRLEFRGG